MDFGGGEGTCLLSASKSTPSFYSLSLSLTHSLLHVLPLCNLFPRSGGSGGFSGFVEGGDRRRTSSLALLFVVAAKQKRGSCCGDLQSLSLACPPGISPLRPFPRTKSGAGVGFSASHLPWRFYCSFPSIPQAGAIAPPTLLPRLARKQKVKLKNEQASLATTPKWASD